MKTKTFIISIAIAIFGIVLVIAQSITTDKSYEFTNEDKIILEKYHLTNYIYEDIKITNANATKRCLFDSKYNKQITCLFLKNLKLDEKQIEAELDKKEYSYLQSVVNRDKNKAVIIQPTRPIPIRNGTVTITEK